MHPKADEHAPYYARYIERVPSGDLVTVLRDQSMETVALLRDVSPELANFAYAPGKWTVKEVVGHVIDSERIFAYRALRFARGDSTELAGFEQDPYVPAGNFGRRSLGDLLEELQVVRAATIHLVRHATDEVLSRRGIASGKEVTVRALFYIIAGHERHHVGLLRERYLRG
jgi:uncharacterized damage-inducible protein DinB